MGWVNNNHYVLLMPRNLNIELTPLEYRNKIYNISDNNKNAQNSNKNSISSVLVDNCNSNNEFDNENSREKINKNELNKQFENYLKYYAKNEFSDFPIIKGVTNGETRLQDIYNFLESEIINPFNKK